MRKQCDFVRNENGFDAWDVDSLIRLSKGVPVKQVPVESIRELDAQHWFNANRGPLTVRALARRVQLVNDVDPSCPIILGKEGQVMDGMHRVVRALIEGRAGIAAVQFEVQPPPDHRDVRHADLPHS